MGNRINLADIAKKLIAKPFAFGCAANKAGNINKFEMGWNDGFRICKLGQCGKPDIWHRNASSIWLDCTERIIGRFGRRCLGQSVEQG